MKNLVRGHQSKWPRDISEAGQRQFQEWNQYRLVCPHEEKVQESSKFQVLMRKRTGRLQSSIRSWYSQGKEVRRSQFTNGCIILSSAVRYEHTQPLRAFKVTVKFFSSVRLLMDAQRSSLKCGETWLDRLAL